MPLVTRYDHAERLHSPPLPFLFQRPAFVADQYAGWLEHLQSSDRQHLPRDYRDLDHTFERMIVETAVTPNPRDVPWINPHLKPGERRKVRSEQLQRSGGQHVVCGSGAGAVGLGEQLVGARRANRDRLDLYPVLAKRLDLALDEGM